ncbi:hypothetical protein EV127DRAFT_494056 [Xylaria flabelliformis]|nr:hypothetical protein EV127DRAFT_494056 [Xylaria flabelliformis]
MIPVIFLIGGAGSGKGTLGPGLASRFNLYHISLGETFRGMRHKRLPGMSEVINQFLIYDEVIPERHLAQFKPGPIPVALQYHNARAGGTKEPYLCGIILREKTTELMSGSVVPRAIVIDGLQMVFESGEDFDQRLQDIAPSFSGLTIRIRCHESVALKRYLQRGRPGNDDIETFGSRMKYYDEWEPSILDFLGNKGVVVETTNDYTMTIDEAVQTLVNNLETVPQWRSLIEPHSGPIQPQTVACSEDIVDSNDETPSSNQTPNDEKQSSKTVACSEDIVNLDDTKPSSNDEELSSNNGASS